MIKVSFLSAENVAVGALLANRGSLLSNKFSLRLILYINKGLFSFGRKRGSLLAPRRPAPPAPSSMQVERAGTSRYFGVSQLSLRRA